MIMDANDVEGVIVPALLVEMLERLGLDREGAQASRGFAGASRRCLRCPKTQFAAIGLKRPRPRRPPRYSVRMLASSDA